MSIMRNKKLWAAFFVCGAGTIFQLLPTSCAQLYADIGLSAFNFCSVFNCTGGAFFNVCDPSVIFVDCPTPATTTP